MPSSNRPTRIGMIVPSSNTCLEPQSYRILGDRRDVTVHFTRIPVTRIALDESSDKQFDPAEEREVDGGALHMGTDFSPFEGKTLSGWPVVVISAGRVVVDDGGFHDPGPVGRFVARNGFAAHRDAHFSGAAAVPAPATTSL